MNWIRFIATISLSLLLGACGSQPPRPVSGGEAAARRPAPPPVSERRGGYYLDDGPGENPPDNLDAVPDAEPRPEPLHKFANNPYSVLGRDYAPATELKPYKARGTASWYGKRFHGQKTSSGEPYDMYAMTAAHPTLPIPSYARVTNMANGRSVVVRINDRGPFHSDRLIDLSYTAAYKLGYVGQGSALVEVERVVAGEAAAAPAGAGVEPPSAAADPIARFANNDGSLLSVPDPQGVYLQLGAFTSNGNAESFRARIVRELAWLGEKMLIVARDGKFRLHVGPYASAEEAGRIAERIREALDLKPVLIQR